MSPGAARYGVLVATMWSAAAFGEVPGGRIFFGGGPAVAAGRDLGIGLSAEFHVEGTAWQAGAQLLLIGVNDGADMQGLVLGRIDRFLSSGDAALYLGGALGYYGQSPHLVVLPSNESSEGLAIGGQFGLMLFREARSGHLALQLQGIVPVSDWKGGSRGYPIAVLSAQLFL